MSPLALYIHWPFCVSKCPYCDFASRPLPDGTDEAIWAQAYARELSFYAERTKGRALSSIYFGGGTPSLMKPETVAAILATVETLWPLAPDCEITLEANPSSSERKKFEAFRAAGVNRLSLGVQSFDDDVLRFLGRAHDGVAARAALDAAAQTFTRFSFDLIYAWAGQTLEAWQRELDRALAFAPRHLSLYQLTIEPRTLFAKKAQRETLTVDEETAAQLFEATQERLERADLPAYEISNHARPGEESRHNLAYWHYDDYLGIGPGAQGRFVDAQGVRRATENKTHPSAWLEAVQNGACGLEKEETLTEEQARVEALMMGLRLREGLDLAAWEEKFGSPLLAFLNEKNYVLLRDAGRLAQTATHFHATATGRATLNAVLSSLLKDVDF